ncbi:hypothetical protein ARMGADRAFT_352989 [Armillaria gallica]|uniref:Uncharacterized protein n=1 Tax=Armillaria gallica TaxID=47427 RepID=A0A2H3DCS6_ARMGA|nr:hypothetical protein ARMGADRAFT_352989 [Armillaria gallica]
MVQLGLDTVHDGVPVIFIEEKKLESLTPITPSTRPCLLTLATVRLVVPRSLHLHRRNILSKAISLSNNTAFAVLPATPLHQSNFQIRRLASLASQHRRVENDNVISPTICFPVPRQVRRSLYQSPTCKFPHPLYYSIFFKTAPVPFPAQDARAYDPSTFLTQLSQTGEVSTEPGCVTRNGTTPGT